MKIYSYYESIPAINQSEEFACSNWWKTSWEKQGWEPVMLNKTHAQASPLYIKLMTKILKSGLPSNPKGMARFTRWASLHATGGGWLSDYDVYNNGFTPKDAEEISSKSNLQIPKEGGYIFYATKEGCAKALNLLVEGEISNGAIPLLESDIFSSEEKIVDIPVEHCVVTNGVQRSMVMSNLAKG
jgi:hypothetical protein